GGVHRAHQTERVGKILLLAFAVAGAVLDPFVAFELRSRARHHLAEFGARIGIEIDGRQVPPMRRAVIGLITRRHLTIEIAVRLRPQPMQSEVGSVELAGVLRLAFGLGVLAGFEGRCRRRGGVAQKAARDPRGAQRPTGTDPAQNDTASQWPNPHSRSPTTIQPYWLRHTRPGAVAELRSFSPCKTTRQE